MVGLRKAQKEMTRNLLLDKGLELFNEQGYSATTVDDIAGAAAVNLKKRRKSRCLAAAPGNVIE